MQLMALRAGGSLHYDLATDVRGAAEHRLGEGRHRVKLTARSRLAEIAGKSELLVSSRHHQAVSDPGPEYRVSALSDDGVIEAIETAAGFRLGVQWHPESHCDAESDALFRAFVAAAQSGRSQSQRRAAKRTARTAK
jgi:putative glutamine amidotransferase